jgi:hypothetical protein
MGCVEPCDTGSASMNLVDELHSVASALTSVGIAYAVCGGVAVTIHGAPRTTKDIDVLVAPADVSRVLSAVAPLGFSFVALPMTFDAGTPASAMSSVSASSRETSI